MNKYNFGDFLISKNKKKVWLVIGFSHKTSKNMQAIYKVFSLTKNSIIFSGSIVVFGQEYVEQNYDKL